MTEFREEINILQGRLPFEINDKTTFNELIDNIDREDSLETGLNDISRELLFRHEIEFYDRDTKTIMPIAPSVDTEIATPNFKEIEKEQGKGFNIEKKEWIKKVIRGMTNSIISNVIERYGRRFGVSMPPGDNIGSIDWLIRVLRITIIEVVKEVIKVPQDILDRIERLEGLIMDSKNTIAEYTEQIADILAKKEEERTDSDKERLLRLDGYIRSENESIRKFESEINRMRKEWKIE